MRILIYLRGCIEVRTFRSCCSLFLQSRKLPLCHRDRFIRSCIGLVLRRERRGTIWVRHIQYWLGVPENSRSPSSDVPSSHYLLDVLVRVHPVLLGHMGVLLTVGRLQVQVCYASSHLDECRLGSLHSWSKKVIIKFDVCCCIIVRSFCLWARPNHPKQNWFLTSNFNFRSCLSSFQQWLLYLLVDEVNFGLEWGLNYGLALAVVFIPFCPESKALLIARLIHLWISPCSIPIAK
jgi:hypothetical protein